jgi:hypothetical protein
MVAGAPASARGFGRHPAERVRVGWHRSTHPRRLQVNVTEMGKVGLGGWRGRAADVVARPIAQRSRFDEDEIKALIGALFLAYTIYRLVRALYRAARTEKVID